MGEVRGCAAHRCQGWGKENGDEGPDRTQPWVSHGHLHVYTWELLILTLFPRRVIPCIETMETYSQKRIVGTARAIPTPHPRGVVSTFLPRTVSLKIQMIWNFLIPHRTPPLEGKKITSVCLFRLSPPLRSVLILAVGTLKIQKPSKQTNKTMSCDSLVI